MALRTYTLHLTESAMRGDGRALDSAKLVRDGFCWPAFAFSVLWFAYHRLWLAALMVLALFTALGFAGLTLGLSPAIALVIVGLALVLVGLEASSLRRWTYGRSGRPARDIVFADSFDQAEIKASARWLDTQRAVPLPASAIRRSDTAVIGLFPESGGGR